MGTGGVRCTLHPGYTEAIAVFMDGVLLQAVIWRIQKLVSV